MTVDVDDSGIRATVRDENTGRIHTSVWSHLFCDTDEQTELHTLARRIGLQRRWFQDHHPDAPWLWHYDVTANKRRHPIAAGAVAISWHEMGAMMTRRAQAARASDTEPLSAP